MIGKSKKKDHLFQKKRQENGGFNTLLNPLYRECTLRYDRVLRHTSSVYLETFRSLFAVTLSLVRSNSWDAQHAVPNDPRYARL
ncbi:hypothetical protein TNCV_5001431 [Trichonephila clavipes]|nr:hypothetical protein TNCV_5001431 [Trichonephila clavipes]